MHAQLTNHYVTVYAEPRVYRRRLSVLAYTVNYITIVDYITILHNYITACVSRTLCFNAGRQRRRLLRSIDDWAELQAKAEIADQQAGGRERAREKMREEMRERGRDRRPAGGRALGVCVCV